MFATRLFAVRRLHAPAACLALLGGLGTQLAAASDAHAPEPKAAAPKAAVPDKGDDAHAKANAHAPRAGKAEAAEVETKVNAKAADKVVEKGVEKVAERNAHSSGAKTSRAAPQDPMDKLRERLAEKLGATPASSSHVMRVAARSPAPVAAVGHHSTAAHAAPPRTQLAALTGAAGSAGAPQEQAAHAAAGHAPHWDYKGDAGPESWGRLKAEFSQCSVGTRQSPIDIRDGIKVQLDSVQFDYKPSGFRVVDNGHTVQVNVAGGNSIEVIGRRYDLVQFHFHRPSEERINGRQFDMVAHLVHKDPEGRLAVVAVLLDRGSAHPVVQTIWNNLPLEKGEEVAARPMLDVAALLPTDRSYFTYMGSLTTPPCSEGVLWMVMKNPVPISTDQIAVFSRLYPMNARPIQSVSGRLIKESN